MALDIIFLVDGSARSISRFNRHKKKYPHLKKLITSDKGIVAFKKAAKLSLTSNFFVVNHEFEILDFEFEYAEFDEKYCHSWQYELIESNPCDDYKSGFDGVFLINKERILSEFTTNIKYIDRIVSKKSLLDVMVISENDPLNNRTFDIVKNIAPEVKRVDASNKKEVLIKACEIAETDNFYVIHCDYIPEDFDFSFVPHSYDEKYIHSWACDYDHKRRFTHDGLYLINKNTFKNLDTSRPNFEYDFGGAEIKLIDEIKCSHVLQSDDIIFISYDEPNAQKNWEDLINRFPYAKCVHKVDGILNAHIQASILSSTPSFYVVDGDSIVEDFFKFDHIRFAEEEQYVHIWKCRNPVNGLEYGYGGIKLFHKSMFKNASDKFVDMSTLLGSGVKLINQVASTTHFNSDEFHAFRSAFRECTKLASGVIKNSDPQSEQRLNTWLTEAKGDYSFFVLLGATLGGEYGIRFANSINDLSKINDFKWLNKKFREQLMNLKTQELLYTRYNKIDTKTIVNLTSLLYDPSIEITLPEIRDCLSRDQLLSKFWLIDELNNLHLVDKLNILVLAGWIGSLSNFIFQLYDKPENIQKIVSLDKDPKCEKIADLFNIDNVIDGWRFKAATGDMLDIDYERTTCLSAAGHFGISWNVLINTSCEHLESIPKWFEKIPKGKLVVVQSNNYFSHIDHHSSSESLEAFEAQCTFSNILYKGTLPCELYDRYMIIGTT